MLLCSTSRVLDSLRVCCSPIFSKRSNLEGQLRISIAGGAQHLPTVQRVPVRPLLFGQVRPAAPGVDQVRSSFQPADNTLMSLPLWLRTCAARNSLPILSLKREFSWGGPQCGRLKILLYWEEKDSVLAVARRLEPEVG